MSDLLIERAAIADLAMQRKCKMTEAKRAWRDMAPSLKEQQRERFRLIRRFIAAAGVISMTGCASNAIQPIKPIPYAVETPVSCVPADMPATRVKPLTPDDLLQAPDGPTRDQLLAEWYILANPRLALLEGVIAACQAAAPAVGGAR